MPDRYRLEITHRDQFYVFELQKEVGLGRQLTPSEPLGKLYAHAGSGEDRIAIAPFSEVRLSRRQLLLRPATGGILVVNPSTNSVFIDETTELAPSAQWLCTSEAAIAFGPGRSYIVRLSLDPKTGMDLHTLPHEPPVPRRRASDRPSDVLSQLQLSTDDASAMRAKLASLIEVLQSAAASADFLERAARAVAELMELDSAHVLLLEEGQWRSRAEHHRQPDVT